MMETISSPWPWYVAGPLLTVVMFLMQYLGYKFGVSSTMETICSIGGAGKLTDYFKVDIKGRMWNIIFIVGAVIGGFIASEFLMDGSAVGISTSTKTHLLSNGILNPGVNYLPGIFSWDNLFTVQGLIFMVLGGFLVGFGTRYAGGCTSGHAISGLSNLQIPSLLATIGFFIGGLIVTHLIIPVLL